MTTENGVVFALGDAQFYGGLPTLDPDATPISAIIGNGSRRRGILAPRSRRLGTTTFTSPTAEGGFPGSAAIVSSAAFPDAIPIRTTGSSCNPYGPCKEWCALFATWAWRAGRGSRHPLVRLRR